MFCKSINSRLMRGALNGLHKTLKQHGPTTTQVALITSKEMRTDRPPKPPPFDYKNKEYTFWVLYTDPFEERFDDNSKVIVVEGPPTIGKKKFAKELAEKLDMYYIPPPSWDEIYIDPYGFDYRTLNPQLSIDAQYYDVNTFHDDPKGRNSLVVQHGFFMLKYIRYIESLMHLFNTGQGVVIQRCPWADMAFMRAALQSGYVSKPGYEYYLTSVKAGVQWLLRPHLVIYLDAPTSIVQDRLRRRGLPHEANSKGLTAKYLDDVANNYKQIVLPTIDEHSHTLVYDWSEPGDVEFVVDDIVSLKFDDYPRSNPKMGDWKFNYNDEFRFQRDFYTNHIHRLALFPFVKQYDIPELFVDAEEDAQREELVSKLQEEGVIKKYEYGFNPEVDKNVLWKTKLWQGHGTRI